LGQHLLDLGQPEVLLMMMMTMMTMMEPVELGLNEEMTRTP